MRRKCCAFYPTQAGEQGAEVVLPATSTLTCSRRVTIPAGVRLTSIDFLPLSAGVFPRAAFLSFSTFLFLLCFLLVHS